MTLASVSSDTAGVSNEMYMNFKKYLFTLLVIKSKLKNIGRGRICLLKTNSMSQCHLFKMEQ